MATLDMAVSTVTGSIKTETKRSPPPPHLEGIVPFSGIVCTINFSHPVEDSHGGLTKDVTLVTNYYRHGNGWMWSVHLKNWRGLCISGPETLNTKSLTEDFSAYSKERIMEWVDDAVEAHYQSRRKIEDAFWSGKLLSV